MATEKTKTRIVDAFLSLAAERRYGDIDLSDIAERAGVPLAALREAYDGRQTIVADFARRIDRAVLAETATTEEDPRERLFDVLMRRFEALRPHKAAVASIAGAARCDPALAAALHGMTLRSMRWMLAAADIRLGRGIRAAARLEGLAVIWLAALRTFLTDDEPDLGRTMAALDRGLTRGAGALHNLDRALAPLRRFGRAMRRRSTERHADAA
jgi:AcrR family transcriptional regulator